MIAVPQSILEATFKQFREHGCGKRECVVYWIGSAEVSDRVDEVVHPVHTSRFGGYQIDDRWLTKFWLDLAARKKSVRAQVHTHPREAFHSRTDDEGALLPETGFLSLVIPNFGLGPVGFEGAYLAERDIEGGWKETPIDLRLEVI